MIAIRSQTCNQNGSEQRLRCSTREAVTLIPALQVSCQLCVCLPGGTSAGVALRKAESL